MQQIGCYIVYKYCPTVIYAVHSHFLEEKLQSLVVIFMFTHAKSADQNGKNHPEPQYQLHSPAVLTYVLLPGTSSTFSKYYCCGFLVMHYSFTSARPQLAFSLKQQKYKEDWVKHFPLKIGMERTHVLWWHRSQIYWAKIK